MTAHVSTASLPSQPETIRGRMPAAFDWYSASLPEGITGDRVLDSLRLAVGGEPRRSAGSYGYGARDDLFHGQHKVASVFHGGSQPRVQFQTSGAGCHDVVGTFRRLWPRHDVIRVDSAVDFDAAGVWETLTGLVLDVADARRIKTRVAGDWLAGQDGRTLYVGGRQAASTLRVYEKGKQMQESGRPDWVRAENQVRPKKREARQALSRLSAGQVWGCAGWTRDIAARLSGADLEPVAMHRWRAPDGERARAALIKQYSATLEDWLAEYDGDVAAWGHDVVARLRG